MLTAATISNVVQPEGVGYTPPVGVYQPVGEHDPGNHYHSMAPHLDEQQVGADGPAASGFGLVPSGNGGGYETVSAAPLRAAEADVRARSTGLAQAPAQPLAQVAPQEGGGSRGISRQSRKASICRGFDDEAPDGYLNVGGDGGEVSIERPLCQIQCGAPPSFKKYTCIRMFPFYLRTRLCRYTRAA